MRCGKDVSKSLKSALFAVYIFKENTMLKNGSFTAGWDDMPPAPGNLINQQPKGWTLRWIEPGKSLFGAADKAGGVPECVHKLSDQLPAHEQLGAPNALILAGNATYKIFHFGAAFGAELKQTVTGLKPGTQATLTVPVLVVLYDDPDPFAAESGVWVDGEGEWVNGGKMGNRNWFRHRVEFTVPENGQVTVEIRVKSKWPRKKDFFIDGITLDAQPADDHETAGPPGDGDDQGETQPDTIVVTVPKGTTVIRATTAQENTVVIVKPKGVKLKVQTGK